MKPAKKQNADLIENQKQTSKQKPTTKINGYFKSVPKTFAVASGSGQNQPEKTTKDFYVNILKEKLRSKNIFCISFFQTKWSRKLILLSIINITSIFLT